MRCLVLLIVVATIYIGAILTTANSGEYNFIPNFFLIPILTAAFFFSGYEVASLLILSSLLTASFLFLNVKASTLLQTILFLTAVSGSAYCLRYITVLIIEWKEKILEVVEEEYASVRKLNNRLEEKKVGLEKMVHDISNLYQVAKEMLSSTHLEELFKCLKKSLKEYFTFTNSKLILFSFKDKELSVDKIYNVVEKEEETDSPSKQAALSIHEDSLIKIMRNRKEPLIIDRSSKSLLPEGLVLPEGTDNLIAVALTAGDRLNGIFCVEGIEPEDTTRLMILIHQFSMVLERIRLYEMVEELAITDGLTSVFVRRYFLERFQEELERAGHFNKRLSFMMIDIDHFKRCNDKYGHLVGDVVLREVAGILKKNLREIDLIGRYGGEEFSVVLPETAKSYAAVAGERLREAIESAEIKAYDEKVKVTISIGMITFPDDTEEINQLIDRADQMLYRAKAEGRNRVKVYG